MNDYMENTGVFFPPKVKRHLRAFYPYLEKQTTSTHALEHRASEAPHPIKLATIKTWIKTCESTHENHCVNSEARIFGKPVWLIDVVNSCVVPAGANPYFALSYTWGAAECTSLTRSNLSDLQKPASLSAVKLARTVKDAINLTARLGYQYLWVDKLCIVQDDLDEKMAQIHAMRAVYAGAYLTIVAAQGSDASVPIYSSLVNEEDCEPICVQRANPRKHEGLQLFDSRCDQDENGKVEENTAEEASSFSDVEKTLTGIFKEDFETTFIKKRGEVDEIIGGMAWEDDPYSDCGSPPDYGNVDELKTALSQFGPETWQSLISEGIMQRLAVELTQSTWFSRGWTFQEYIFSPRRLVFHSNTVNWDCHCASWHENQRHITSEACYGGKNSILGIDTNSWPNVYRLVRLICLFNVRFLTRQEDVLDAFEGPLQSFGAVFDGGFISGLPQMFFDAALLWQPYAPLTRRTPFETVPATESILPSWSWVGWQGNLHSESWLACFDYIITESGWSGGIIPSSTHSTVKWQLSTTSNSRKTPIIVSADVFRKKYSSPSKSDSNRPERLPDGWSGSYDYYNYKCPKAFQPFGNPFHETRQPFKQPLPTMNAKSKVKPSIRAGFLHGHTRTATLKITNLLSGIPSVRHGCVTAALGYSDKLFAGYLRLNEDSNTVKTQIGDSCTLIELSSGLLQDEGDENYSQTLDWEGGDSFTHIKSFFNVMWVEWRDGVAYRKAVGRVEESVWRAVFSREIDVVLG
ncbi:heterokaryon incompatibility protein [Glarea lozoyensis ATCC 20868]|uniref:Heterokaryon incompatibility protein n=1 Tax=Glarea lozoyensis (strain ATCC 20868 / MF5171) TaxID=1116229 RepID=S3CF72_GLAL2|nr:heterokaryon incompatibility protein [Glarea lozoyensis ATCC 20868]EPE25152.1 heterokaryon incompatibility protein [Glarea lozoyensis ATCC 20868]